MYLIRDIHNIDFFNKKFSSKPLIATIGNFDGLHLGHKEIIKKMKSIGDENDFQSLVIFTAVSYTHLTLPTILLV